MSSQQQSIKKSLRLFFNAEYTNLEVLGLISVALVGQNHHQFYAESSDFLIAECSEFVKSKVLPNLDGGDCVFKFDQIKAELTAWLNRLLIEYQELSIYFDYDGDLIVLSRLLSNYELKNNINYIKVAYGNIRDTHLDQNDREHHALWGAKKLYLKWKIVANLSY